MGWYAVKPDIQVIGYSGNQHLPLLESAARRRDVYRQGHRQAGYPIRNELDAPNVRCTIIIKDISTC